MDWNIGKLRQAINSLGVADSTLILFLSDNGPENGAGSAGPFRGIEAYKFCYLLSSLLYFWFYSFEFFYKTINKCFI